MARAGGPSWKTWRLPLGAAASTAAAFAFAPAAGVLLGLAWFLVLAAAYDNHSGSCLMVATLVVIVLAILAALVAMTALPLR